MIRHIKVFLLGLLVFFSPTAEALDPLRIDGRIGVIHLYEFIREFDDRRAFAVQNGSESPLILELQRHPTQWPLASFLNIETRRVAPLGLIASDGKELAADWSSPNQVTFTVPPLSVQSYVFTRYPGPARHLWLWGENSRVSFERDARLIWTLLFAGACFVWLAALTRRMLNGLELGFAPVLMAALASGIAAFCLKASTVLPANKNLYVDDKLIGAALAVALILHLLNWWRYFKLAPVVTGYWLTVRSATDLSILAAFGVWGWAMVEGPFAGYITLDLFPLALLVTSILQSLGVFLASSIADQQQTVGQASPPDDDN